MKCIVLFCISKSRFSTSAALRTVAPGIVLGEDGAVLVEAVVAGALAGGSLARGGLAGGGLAGEGLAGVFLEATLLVPVFLLDLLP